MNKKMVDAINAQINAEIYSAYLYLSMSEYFEDIGLSGAAAWMFTQYQEETLHGMKFVAYLNERGERVILEAIEKPATEWKGPLEVFEEVYAHEQKVTSLINNLMDIAISENDHATKSFLNWYVDEQVEEEANTRDIRDRMKLIGDNTQGLLMLDRELATRGTGVGAWVKAEMANED